MVAAVIVHLVDGTYELFRYFLSPAAAFDRSAPEELRAVRGVVGSILGMLEDGVTHVGVATDHVIESFRNALWPGYKTGEGLDPLLYAQFQPLEEALTALGVVVWPMVDFEADDALAAAAAMAAADARVVQVVVCTPDKDLAQCVRGALRLATTLAEQGERALLFRTLATLRADAPIGADVDALRWRGPRPDFATWAERLGTPPLHDRVSALAVARAAVTR